MKEKDLAMFITNNINVNNLTVQMNGKIIITIFECKSNNPNSPGRNIKLTNEFIDFLCHNGFDVNKLKTELMERNIYIMNENLL